MVLQRVVKPKNQRVKRELAKRESKLEENDKTCMFIKGGNTSDVVTKTLKDLYSLKKPLAIMYKKKNIIRPLDDATSVEFFANKCDSSLFLFGSHSKKRPHNLIFGRLFDFHILDMIELGVEKFRPMSDFPASKCGLGTKPCLLFAGESFEQDVEHRRLKNLFIDFFRGPVVEHVRLSGLEHVISFTALEDKFFIRSYKITLKKSGSRLPRIELEEMGPSVDLVLRRSKIASDDLYKTARRQPIQATPRKRKNISHDPFGTKKGRIHMQSQDLSKLQLRKLKGLKKRTLDGVAEASQEGTGAEAAAAAASSSKDLERQSSPKRKRKNTD